MTKIVRTWISPVLKAVSKKMRMLDSDGFRQSRRILAAYCRDDEIEGFRNVCIFVDSALFGRESVISLILSEIDGYIYGREHRAHGRYLMFFSSESESLAAPGDAFMHGRIPARSWEATIARYLKPNSSAGPVFVPPLNQPSALGARFPGTDDLALFFTRGEPICKYERAQKQFVAIRHRSLWFIFQEGVELPQFLSEGVIPELRQPGAENLTKATTAGDLPK